MQTTGSRLRLQFPPGVLRLLVGATIVFAVLAILAGNSGSITGKAEAGVVSKVTVNSRGNTDDSDCEGAPNDNVVGGDCTLVEAINDANNGLADLINFHPAVFPENAPGTIIIDGCLPVPPANPPCTGGGVFDAAEGIPGNLGCLPSIQRDGIIIDATGAGVIIDGDDDDDPSAELDGTPEECVAAILAEASSNGFDFTVIGNGHLTIKQFDADGIQIDGDTTVCSVAGACSLGNIDISGVTIEQIGSDGSNTDGNTESLIQETADDTDGGGGDAIDIENVSGANQIHINDNIIDTEYPDFSDGDNAVDIDIDRNLDASDGIFDDDMLIDISGNSLNADTDAVEVTVTGDLGDPFTGDINSATIQVNDNNKVSSDSDSGVDIDWNGCIFKSPLVIEVDGNSNIQSDNSAGSADAVEIAVNASAENGDCKEIDSSDPLPDGTEFAQVTVSVSDNRNVGTPAGDDGVDIDVLLCCGSVDGHAKNVVNVHVDRNEDIRGNDHGVDINTDICCYDGNSSTVTLNDNDEITGQHDDGVDIHNDVGATDAASAGQEDGDDNIGTVEVNGNGRITSGDGSDPGVNIDNHVGAFFKGSGDANLATVELMDNERITGSGDDGVMITNRAGSGVHNFGNSGGGEADDNTAGMTISGNGEIIGHNDGVDVDNMAGSLSFFNTNNQAEGDGNTTKLVIDGNDDIRGLSDDGIDADVFAGGDTKGSTRNVNNVDITDNGQIEGDGSDGIELDADVCCTTQKQGNENVINISLNAKIIGQNDDGIEIDVCCTSAINRTEIVDNGRIVGGDNNGIDYVANPGDDSPGDGVDVGLSHDLKQDGFINTVNELIITGNLIENAEDNGIYVCCGAFESDANDVKSLIKDNTITKNAGEGIEIDTSFGLNIETNEIFLNGDEADSDAGILIHNLSSIGQGDHNLSSNVFGEVPANHNRISQNSIYDNKGLGIDLAADPDLDGLDDGEDFGVGCVPKAEPINPNDCLAPPSFLVPAKVDGQTAVTGRTCALCTVELFIADQDPADQGKSPLKQSGEGRTYITNGQADEEGNFSIVLSCTLDLPPDTLLTATATDKVKNTSEFSQNLTLPSGSHDCTPVPTNTNTPPPPTPVPPTNTPVIVVVTATPGAVTPASPTATNTPSKACGDVDDNGSVNAVDAQLVLQYKAGLISSLPNLPSADVNDSGEVTSVDAALILQVSAGLIPPGALHCPS